MYDSVFFEKSLNSIYPQPLEFLYFKMRPLKRLVSFFVPFKPFYFGLFCSQESFSPFGHFFHRVETFTFPRVSWIWR